MYESDIEHVLIKQEDDIINITINKNIPLLEFIMIKENFDINFKLPLENMVFDYDILVRQKIFIIDNSEHKKLITLSHDYIYISHYTNKHDIEISINRKDNSFYINKANLLDGSYEEYNSISNNNTLSKKVALYIARNIFDYYNSYYLIRNYMFSYDPYESLSIVPKKNYNPLITNNIITISWPLKDYCDDINEEGIENLDIILNETRERVGHISYYFVSRKELGFTLDGNIGYSIDEKFRNKGYATMALSLLKKVVKNNIHNPYKRLYISTELDNIYSQKVAINNGGKICYQGSVPENDPLNYDYGIKNVKVYEIKI